MKRLAAVPAFFILSVGASIAQTDLGWTAGVGMEPCSALASIGDSELLPWIEGYWTGANLYLGGSDLCVERAWIERVPVDTIRPLLVVQCASIPGDTPIMMAAFDALKGLPKLEGSRAAACGGKKP